MERGSQIVESKVNFKSNPKLSPPPFNTWVANPAAKTRLPFGFSLQLSNTGRVPLLRAF